MKRIVKLIPVALFLLLIACDRERIRPESGHEYDSVAIFYFAGYFPGSNDLSEYLRTNINEIEQGYLPSKNSGDVVILFTNLTDDDEAYMVRMYRDRNGLVCDTLAVFPQTASFAKAENFTGYLTKVRDMFDAEHYGLVLSSHGSGWTPEGYFFNPVKSRKGGALFGTGPAQFPRGTNPYTGFEGYHPGMPTKSIFIESGVESGVKVTYEMGIDVMRDALPMHLDYLIMDACYMGCVEVAYELRDVADYIVFSQTEIVASSMDYVNMMSRLIEQSVPDLQGVCKDFFDKYDVYPDGSWKKTCLVSLVDCSRLDRLASVVAGLNDRYGNALDKVNPRDIQTFSCINEIPLFYDLQDIYRAVEIEDTEMSALENAIDDCIKCRYHTNFLLNDILVGRFSGLSMYLPCKGNDYLDDYYRTLAWNMDTGLVK